MRNKSLGYALFACLLLATVAAIAPAQAEEPLAIENEVAGEPTHSYKTYLIVSKNKGDYALNTVYQGLVVNNLPPVPLMDSSLPSSAPEGDGDQTIPIASLDTTPLTPSGYAPLRLILADIPKKADVVAVEVRDPLLGTVQTVDFRDANVDLMDGEGQNVTAIVSGLWVMPDRSYEVALVAASGVFMESVAQLLTTNEEASNALHSATEPQPMGGGTAQPPGTGSGGGSSGGCQPRTSWSWSRYLSNGDNFGNTLSADDDDLLNRANGIQYRYGDGCYSSSYQNGYIDFGYGIEGASLRVGTGLWTIFSALDYNGARNMQQSGTSNYKGHSIIVDDVHVTMLLPTDLGATYIATTNPKQASWSCSETMPSWFFAALQVVDKTGIVSSVIPDEVCTENWANYYSQKHNSGPAGGYISLQGSDSAEKHLGAYMIYEFNQRGPYTMDMEVKANVDADMRGCFGSCGWVTSTKDYWTWQTRDNKIG